MSTTSPNSIDRLLDNANQSGKGTVITLGQNVWTGLRSPATVDSTWWKPPTSKDIPPVTLTNITHIDPSAFRDYLRQSEDLFNAIQSSRVGPGGGGAQAFHQGIFTSREDEYRRLIEHRERRTSSTSISSQRTGASEDYVLAGSPRGWQKTTALKRNPLAPAPLNTIPSVYFDESFRLENPRTFDLVVEHAQIVRQPVYMNDGGPGTNSTATSNSQPIGKALIANIVLQEKLSWYVDIVEVHLLSSISQASASFFTALGSLRELHAEATDLIAKIQKLRKDLALSDKGMALHGLKVVHMKRRTENVQKLGDCVKQLQYVIGGASHCEDLVASGQLDIAIQQISYVKQLVSGTLDPNTGGESHLLLSNPFIRLVDLRQMHALEGLLQSIDQLHLRIGRGYETRLLDTLLGDVRQHVAKVPPMDTLSRWMYAVKRVRGATDASIKLPTSMMSTEELRAELIPILRGLGQTQYLAAASTAFRQAVIREMKSLIRQYLPSSTDDDNESVVSAFTQTSGRHSTQQKKPSILSRNLRAFSPQDAERFFVKVYCGIGQAMRRLSVQSKVLLDVTSDMKVRSNNVLVPLLQSLGGTANSMVGSLSRPVEVDLQEELTRALDMSSLLGQAVEKAQSEMTKILRVRTEQTLSLELKDFLSYVTLNSLFANECEAVSGYSGTALQGIVNNQIHDFIPRLHETEKQKLVQRMEAEKWDCIDFSPEDAAILTRVIESATTDPTKWLRCMDATTIGREVDERDQQTKEAATELASDANQDKQDPMPAIIEQERFIHVESAAFALRGIEQYAILLTSVPGMANDISKVLLDYLRLYNSRVHQLILGAGARRTAGLANISAKHLTLASQSLSFFRALIPYLRESVRRRSSVTASDVLEYDRLRHLLQDHQSSIHDTLINIMMNRASNCVRVMEKTEWDDENEVQRNVSAHMETLAKETLRLKRILSKYLPAASASMIMSAIFMNYKEQLSKAFGNSVVRTKLGQARLLRDAELLQAKLDKLDDAEELGAHMINIVRMKDTVSLSETSTKVLSNKAQSTSVS